MAVYERKEGFAKAFSKRSLLRFAIESQEQLVFYCSPVVLSESGELSGTFLSKIHRIFFIFIGKTRTTAKILHRESNGLTLYVRKLSEGRFQMPRLNDDSKTCTLEYNDFVKMILGAKWEEK